MLLGVYALTQILGGSDVTYPVTEGDLTLTGRTASFAVTTAGDKGDLTLTGVTATLTSVMAVVNGALVLTGQDATFSTAISGEGDLTLTGRDALLTVIIVTEPATLTLTPNWADLLPIGGGSSRKKKPRTGFEPIAKVHVERTSKPKKKPLLPPPDLIGRIPSIIPTDEPLPDFAHEAEPADLLGLQDQIYTAQDASDVEAFLRSYDQDQQDAADIADILDRYKGSQASRFTLEIAAKVAFNHENRLRALEGKATVTANQFANALKAIL